MASTTTSMRALRPQQCTHLQQPWPRAT
jgi:hypothetical protein